jgi:trans-2,3-dihydro-3-hydroxyanthranilate isomerase
VSDIDIAWEPGAHRYFVLDVFTDTPLCGNQLAVFASGESFDGAQMQRIARELQLSETVFLLAPESGGDARARIFTPAVELPFAGHPVLGTAFVLAMAKGLDEVALETGAGVIPVTLERTGEVVTSGRMVQPMPTWEPFERAAELLEAVGVAGSSLPLIAYTNGPVHVYVVLEDERAVAELRPDGRALESLGAVCVSCLAAREAPGAGGTRSWKTRMFAPAMGVPEDSATGSGAGPLALHLARHGRIAFGEEIEIHQGAEIGRPSLLRARVHGTPEAVERIEVGGSAVLVARGEFRL